LNEPSSALPVHESADWAEQEAVVATLSRIPHRISCPLDSQLRIVDISSPFPASEWH